MDYSTEFTAGSNCKCFTASLGLGCQPSWRLGNPSPLPSPYLSGQEICLETISLCMSFAQLVKRVLAKAQLINGLWRVFCQTGEARINLHMAGLTVRGLAMRFYDKNPYRAVDGDGGQVCTTKLIISDLPMYMPEAEVEETLLMINVDIRSKIMHRLARDEKGKLSRFTTGPCFVYIDLPGEPLPKSFDFGIFKP